MPASFRVILSRSHVSGLTSGRESPCYSCPLSRHQPWFRLLAVTPRPGLSQSEPVERVPLAFSLALSPTAAAHGVSLGSDFGVC